MTDIIIKKSKIHGTGIFAGRDFKKGEIVIRWHPVVLTKREMEKLSTDEKHYTYKIEEDKYYLMQEPERFMNHSCENNTHVVDSCDVAIRDIKKGEEITANYDNDGMVEFDCKCESVKCKGRIK